MTATQTEDDADAESQPRSTNRIVGSIWLPFAITGIACVLFISAQFAIRGWDPTLFIVAGDQYVDAEEVSSPISVNEASDGYDGQFFYALALNPFTTESTVEGITIDVPAYRQQRIGYPFLVWLLSGGNTAAVGAMMLLVNLAALMSVALLGAAIARDHGHSPMLGIILPAFPGFVFALTYGTAEIVAVAFMVAGLYAITRHRYTWASAALAAACLTRETVLLVPIAIAGIWLWESMRRHDRILSMDFKSVALVAGVPIAATVGLQFVLMSVWGEIPVLAGGNNVGAPFVGISQFLSTAPWGTVRTGLALGELALLAAMSGAVVALWRSSKAPPHEKIAWALSILLVAALNYFVWIEDVAFMRAAAQPWALGSLIVLRAPGLTAGGFATAACVLSAILVSGAYF